METHTHTHAENERRERERESFPFLFSFVYFTDGGDTSLDGIWVSGLQRSLHFFFSILFVSRILFEPSFFIFYLCYIIYILVVVKRTGYENKTTISIRKTTSAKEEENIYIHKQYCILNIYIHVTINSLTEHHQNEL